MYDPPSRVAILHTFLKPDLGQFRKTNIMRAKRNMKKPFKLEEQGLRAIQGQVTSAPSHFGSLMKLKMR